MNKFLKYFLIVLASACGLFIVGLLALNFMIAMAFGSFDKKYSASELKDEYYSKEKEITELINYYNHIKPEGYCVDIEFKDDNTLARFQVISKDSLSKSNVIYQEWDISTDVLQKG